MEHGSTRPARARTRRIAIATAAVAAVFVATVAFAEWLANGTGEGYARAGHVEQLTTESATPSATLYPGTTGDLALRIHNPNPFPVTVSSVSPNGTVASDIPACDQAGTGVTFATQNTSLVVPASSSATFVLADSVTMAPDAPSACQDATFTIPVSLNGGSSALSTWYQDADGDGFGDPAVTTLAALAPTGFVGDATDCDDTNAGVNPAAPEVADPNDIDEDCDGLADDDDPDMVGGTSWYPDLDEDSYGDASATPVVQANPPQNHVADATDCDDANATVHPGAIEVVGDAIDNDCDGTVDEG